MCVVLFNEQLCDVQRAISENMKHVLLQMNASGTVCAFAMLSTLRHVLAMEEEEEEEGVWACGGVVYVVVVYVVDVTIDSGYS